MKIPFFKAHGAKNDFLLTWARETPSDHLSEVAARICDRHTGIGADGWILVRLSDVPEHDAAIELFNSDGSTAEVSGNGTRCAAAFLMHHGFAGADIRILTGAGVKHLRLLNRVGLTFSFEMNMGRPEYTDTRSSLLLSTGTRDVTVLSAGNPQCVVPVEHFDFDWPGMGAEIEAHTNFPNRTNVSFVRPVDAHTIEARFYERGAGQTMSSGTGSTGAAVAAILRGWAQTPVRVLTPAGPLDIRWDGDVYLQGPAEIVAEGSSYYEKIAGNA